jgi:hypothetical protein
MPRKAKPDDPDWIDLSANQKRQVKAAMRRIAKTGDQKDDWDPYAITPPEVQMKYLRAYHEDTGPHINFENSFVAKVAGEAFQKAARRKLN